MIHGKPLCIYRSSYNSVIQWYLEGSYSRNAFRMHKLLHMPHSGFLSDYRTLDKVLLWPFLYSSLIDVSKCNDNNYVATSAIFDKVGDSML